jgi:hypothetical protein
MSPARQRRASGGTSAGGDSERAGVPLTHLDEELFDGAQATKRDLIDYLEALSGPMLAALADRPLSVIRVLRGREAFMQKNVPRYTPDFVPPKRHQGRERIAAVGGGSSRRGDGGVDDETIGRCAEAGADMFVAGTAVYGAEDPARAVSALRERAAAAAAAPPAGG